MASVKRLKILRDEFRNRRPGMVDEVMAIGCTLHNFRCDDATGSPPSKSTGQWKLTACDETIIITDPL